MTTGWDLNQTRKLFGLVKSAHKQGKGLNWAFSKVAEETKRSVNSVRNYYYSQLKMFELVPNLKAELKIETISSERKKFALFTDAEITNLIESILIAKAKGISVRACIAKLSRGDTKKALRLQNKYRSMIAHQKRKVVSIMNALSKKGTLYYNPYTKLIGSGQPESSQKLLGDYLAKLDEKEVEGFITMMQKLFA